MAKELFPDTTKGKKWPPKEILRTPKTTGSANEVQTETVTATGGTRTLSFNGQTTSALAFDANAATIQAALVALSNVDAGDIVVSGTGPYVYTFGGAWTGINAPAITVNTGSLTGGSSAIITTIAGGTLHPTLNSAIQASITREYTQEALMASGFGRPKGAVNNDLETFNLRKPKDIGQEGRDPFEK